MHPCAQTHTCGTPPHCTRGADGGTSKQTNARPFSSRERCRAPPTTGASQEKAQKRALTRAPNTRARPHSCSTSMTYHRGGGRMRHTNARKHATMWRHNTLRTSLRHPAPCIEPKSCTTHLPALVPSKSQQLHCRTDQRPKRCQMATIGRDTWHGGRDLRPPPPPPRNGCEIQLWSAILDVQGRRAAGGGASKTHGRSPPRKARSWTEQVPLDVVRPSARSQAGRVGLGPTVSGSCHSAPLHRMVPVAPTVRPSTRLVRRLPAMSMPVAPGRRFCDTQRLGVVLVDRCWIRCGPSSGRVWADVAPTWAGSGSSIG